MQWVVVYRQGGKRQVRNFTAEKAAKAFADEKHIELLNQGRERGEITGEERRAIAAAREAGFSVKAAVEHYVRHHAALNTSAAIGNAVDEYLALREAEGKSRDHIADLRHRLGRFAGDHGGRLAASITTRDLDQWLAGLAVAAQTSLNYRRAAHALFNFCVARGYCPTNPVTAAMRVKVPPAPIGILTVEQAEALMAACPAAIVPAVAIGLFGGLRASEIARLDWRAVDLDQRFIEVGAAKSKTAQRRLISISDNLRTWLEPYRQAEGPVRPPAITYRRKFLRALRTAGITHWPPNALRHSFGSYHLSRHENAAKTALELGHTESATLFRHYRQLVKSAEAALFWQIAPSKANSE